MFNKKARQHDPELARTLMLVRAMNPALADEIEATKAYDRLGPLMATGPARARKKPMSLGRFLFFVVGVLIVIKAVTSGPTKAPAYDARATGGSSAPPSAACDSDCQDRKARRAVEFGLKAYPPPGHDLSDAEVKDDAADVVDRLRALSEWARKQ